MDNNTALTKSVGTLPAFLSGEKITPEKVVKFVPSVVGLTAVGVGAWAFVKYALPAIMTITSAVLAGGIAVFLVAFGVAIAKPVWRWMKGVGHVIKRAAIKFNPEIEVENRLMKFDEMANIYKDALASMNRAAANFSNYANEAEKSIEEKKQRLEANKKKMEELRLQRDQAQIEVNRLKADVNSGKLKTRKEREPYHEALRRLTDIQIELDKLASRVTSDSDILKMKRDSVQNYAAKANIFANWVEFLRRGVGLIQNKKEQMNEWWTAVKQEMEAAKAGKDATEALKFVLYGEDGQKYDFDFATEYIMNQIDKNYSITAENMRSLMDRVDTFDFDSDDAYDQLERLLKDLETGEVEMPFAAEIATPVHQLTSSERAAAGVLGQIF